MASSRLSIAVASTLFVACADAEQIVPPAATTASHQVSFVGYVYDGATGPRVGGYDLSLVVGETTMASTLEEDARFRVGPLSAWDDFTVIIEADGFRLFRSHNPHIGLPPELSQSDDIADISTSRVLHFDAYLFPSNVLSPAVTFTIETPTGDPVSGSMRLRPTSASLLEDELIEQPSGVPGQLWTNDEDLQSATVTQSFSDGELSLGEGDLVYGVTYQVTIFDVPGYQPLEDTYTAGVETNKTFELLEEVSEPLAVVTDTSSTCAPPPLPNSMSSAIFSLELNYPIELVDSGFPGGAVEALDDGLSISSPNTDADALINTLNPDVAIGLQERGVTIVIMGDTLTVTWNPSIGLMEVDPNELILSVTYSGLGNVQVQRVGSPASAASLQSLMGVASVTCMM